MKPGGKCVVLGLRQCSVSGFFVKTNAKHGDAGTGEDGEEAEVVPAGAARFAQGIG